MGTMEAQYSSRELNYLLDKDYFETDDDPKNETLSQDEEIDFSKNIKKMEISFKNKLDEKPFEEEEDEDDDGFDFFN